MLNTLTPSLIFTFLYVVDSALSLDLIRDSQLHSASSAPIVLADFLKGFFNKPKLKIDHYLMTRVCLFISTYILIN